MLQSLPRLARTRAKVANILTSVCDHVAEVLVPSHPI